MAETTRLNVNLNTATAEALTAYAAKHNITLTEAVRRAISLLDFAEKAREGGERLLIQSQDRKTQREVVLL